MYGGESIGTDDGVVALSTYEGRGAKFLSSAKLRLYWRLLLDGNLHEIHFQNSKNSGKKRVFVDGVLVHQEVVYRVWNFTHTLTIGSHLLSIVPRTSDGGGSPRNYNIITKNNIFSKAAMVNPRVPRHPHDLVFDEQPWGLCSLCQRRTAQGTRFRSKEDDDFAVCARCYDEHGVLSQESPEFELRINGLPFSSFVRKPHQQNAARMGRPSQTPSSTASRNSSGAQRRDGAVAPESEGTRRYPFNLSGGAFVEKNPQTSLNGYVERQPKTDPWQPRADVKPDQKQEANKDVSSVGFGLEPPKSSSSTRQKSDWSLTPRSRRSSNRSNNMRRGSGDYKGLMEDSSDDEDLEEDSEFDYQGGGRATPRTSLLSDSSNPWGAASQPWNAPSTSFKAPSANPWDDNSSCEMETVGSPVSKSDVANSWASHPWAAAKEQHQEVPRAISTPKSPRKTVPTQLLPWEPTAPGVAATAFQVPDKLSISKAGAPKENLESASFLDNAVDSEYDDKEDLNDADLDEQRAIMASLEAPAQPSKEITDPFEAPFQSPKEFGDPWSEVKPQSPAQAPDPWSQAFSDQFSPSSWHAPAAVASSSENRQPGVVPDPWTAAMSAPLVKVIGEAPADPWGIFDAPASKNAGTSDPWSNPPQLQATFSRPSVAGYNPFEESESSPSSPSTSPWPDASGTDTWGVSPKLPMESGWPPLDRSFDSLSEETRRREEALQASRKRDEEEQRNEEERRFAAARQQAEEAVSKLRKEEAEKRAAEQQRAEAEWRRLVQPKAEKPPRSPGSALREALRNAEPSGIEAGASITVFGLSGAAHLNGLSGIVERWDTNTARWIVSLENGETKSLRPSNCALVSSPSASAPSKPSKRPSIQKSPAEIELQDLFPQVDLPVIQQALAVCHGNVQVAANWLAEHIPDEEVSFPSRASPSSSRPGKVRRRALLIGINYFGTKAELRGCINDVWNMKRLLVEKFGWDSSCMRYLVDDNPHAMPTKANINSSLRWLVEGVQPGDILFFHFSGHGAQQEDPHGYEEDGMNETICPVDFQKAGMISDDEIGEMLVKHLPEGVRLTAIMDCCHSGTGLDLPFSWRGRGWTEETNPYHSAGDVQLFSGCEDDDCSADAMTSYGAAGGAMTTAFCDVLRDGPVGPSYPELMASLDKLMRKRGFSQRPQLTSSQQFNVDRPFGLDDAVSNSNAQLGRIFRKKFPPRPRRMSGPLASMLDDAGLLVLGGMMAASVAPMAMDMGSSLFGMTGMASDLFDGFWT